MITLKTPQQIVLMRQAGRIVAELLTELNKLVKPGLTTKELDDFSERFILERKALPAFKGYHGYPCTICTSINEEVVHGIPSSRKLREGDLLSIDAGAVYQGFYGDAALTLPVGKATPEMEKLMTVTKGALQKGIEAARAGAFLSDISNAVQSHVE